MRNLDAAGPMSRSQTETSSNVDYTDTRNYRGRRNESLIMTPCAGQSTLMVPLTALAWYCKSCSETTTFACKLFTHVVVGDLIIHGHVCTGRLSPSKTTSHSLLPTYSLYASAAEQITANKTRGRQGNQSQHDQCSSSV